MLALTLTYPLGNSDEDPEDLLTFEGAEAIPKPDPTDDPLRWRRGLVMIDFFGLNRDGLQFNRASWLLKTVWPDVKLMRAGDLEANDNVDWLCSEQAPFTSCAKCFVDACAADPSAPDRLLPVLRLIVGTVR